MNWLREFVQMAAGTPQRFVATSILVFLGFLLGVHIATPGKITTVVEGFANEMAVVIALIVWKLIAPVAAVALGFWIIWRFTVGRRGGGR